MRAYESMPEPKRSILLGHLPEWLGVSHAERVLQRLQRYAEECGPVARVSLGPARLVFISDADVAAAVLSDERANYKGAAYILTRAVLDNVLLLNGEAWANARKTYRLALRNVDVLAAARKHSERAAAEWRGEVALDRATMRLVGDIVGDFVCGASLPEALEEDRALIQYELAALGIDLQCRPWSYLSPLRWWRLKRSVKNVREFFASVVAARGDEERRDVLDGFKALARAGEYPNDAAAMQDGVVNFFFTAHEVVASTTAWMLWLLATHPEVQAELRASPEYIDCVARESLRLFPGYSLFGRTTRADMEIGGYAVPKGTFLICSPFVTQRLERYWPNALSFDPSRWRGRAQGPIPPMAKDAYFPFGSGARGCLASHLALPLVKTIVQTIVSRVDLTARQGHVPDVMYWGTALSKNGLPIRASEQLIGARERSVEVA